MARLGRLSFYDSGNYSMNDGGLETGFLEYRRRSGIQPSSHFFSYNSRVLTSSPSPATRLCFDTTHDGFYKFKGPLWSFTGKEAGHGHFSDFKKGSPNGQGLV
jgi:hypothetical protein